VVRYAGERLLSQPLRQHCLLGEILLGVVALLRTPGAHQLAVARDCF
jgi:hypothetical protein